MAGRATAVSLEGETPDLGLMIDSPTQATVSGALEALALLGSVPPFSFVVRLYSSTDPAAYVDSGPVSVTQGANPLDDAQYLLQADAPGSDPLAVGAYTLGYLPSPAPGDGAVTVVPVTPPGGGPQRRHSFAVWFSSINGPSPAGTFAFCQLTGAGAFQMKLGAANDLQVTDYLWSANDPGPPYGTDATWHLFVLTRDNNTIRVYYDGAEIIFDPTAQLVDFDNPNPTLDVGQMSVFFNSIGTGAVWFRALSPAEVTALQTLTTFPP